MIDQPVTGKYEWLKSEVIKKLTDLKKLAIPSISDDYVLTLWKDRFPVNTRRVLSVASGIDANVLTEITDRIHEI